MNLLSFLKPVAKPLVDGLLADAEAQKPAILAKLAVDNVKAADVVETALVEALSKDPHIAPLASALNVKAIVAAQMPALVAAFGSEEAVLFEAIMARVRALETAAFA